MANDLTGVTGVRGAPIPPGAPVRPAEPSRALVPVRPLDATDTASPRSDTPLGRSGLTAIDLLLTSDIVVEREAVATVALEAGLESARGALLRQHPGDALAALDDIWARASLSEEGWYLRSGALTMLGQAEEGDRVASEGLFRAPASVALRFLQSVARTLTGDFAGARAALTPALEAAPEHPVLLAHHLLLLARQGRTPEAEPLLRRLAAAFPEHPAAQWAEREFRAIKAGFSRTASRHTASMDGTPAAEHRAPPVGAEGDRPSGDAGEDAFAELGERLSVAGASDAVHDARTLLRAFSSGGSLAGLVLADQAHGARTVLAAIIGALQGDARTAGPSVVRQVVKALRDGRVMEMERTIRREARILPYPQRRWIEALLRDVCGARATPVSTDVRAGEYETILHQVREDGPELPVRLGLGLLTDSPVARAVLRTPDAPSLAVSADAVSPYRTPDGRLAAVAVADLVTPAPPDAPAALNLGLVLPPVLALAVALAAGLNGASFIAGVAVAAAVWLAFRRID